MKMFQIIGLTLALCSTSLWAGEVQVAVASNFTKPMEKIAEAFKTKTGHDAKLSFGASGAFATQIRNGAPFEVFLSADDKKAKGLVEEKLALADTAFIYAQGKLVLWSVQDKLVDEKGKVLESDKFKHIALADPKLAPYGAAAMQVLDHLKLTDKVKDKIVQGENIGQTMQFVSTGNAELGFVALSQVISEPSKTGSMWLVPSELYDPINQQAMLLTKGEKNEAATALMTFLKSNEAISIIETFGYKVPSAVIETPIKPESTPQSEEKVADAPKS
ncbi:MAG: hypothetical protein RLZZ422_2187 [Pseudomonadota bacterium]|jgi:molybdate transport system substrate-binding protein